MRFARGLLVSSTPDDELDDAGVFMLTLLADTALSSLVVGLPCSVVRRGDVRVVWGSRCGAGRFLVLLEDTRAILAQTITSAGCPRKYEPCKELQVRPRAQCTALEQSDKWNLYSKLGL